MIHTDKNIGVTMHDACIEQINNAHGQHYWKASAQKGSLFGFQVYGQLVGIGRTKEEALARLAKEEKNLADSIWD